MNSEMITDYDMRGYIVVENVYSIPFIKKNRKGALFILFLIYLIVLSIIVITSFILLSDLDAFSIVFAIIIYPLMALIFIAIFSAIIYWMSIQNCVPRIYSNGILHFEKGILIPEEMYIPFRDIDKIFNKLNSASKSLIADLKAEEAFTGKKVTEGGMNARIKLEFSNIDKTHLFIITKTGKIIEWDKSWIDDLQSILKIFKDRAVDVY